MSACMYAYADRYLPCAPTPQPLSGKPCNYNGDGVGFDFSWMDPGAMAVSTPGV